MRTIRGSAGFVIVLLGFASASSTAQVAAPVLKWAYGGCSPSSCQTGWYAGPAVGNIDADAEPEVVWGNYDLVALTALNGAVEWRATSGLRIWPAVVIADLEPDGTPEVVVGREENTLVVYNANGSVRYTRNPFANGEVRTLIVDDIDGNGDLEIVVARASGGGTRQVNVYEHDGSVRAGWPARRDGEQGFGAGMFNQNIAVADFDGNGRKEIVAPTDTHYITALDPDGNQLPANAVYGAGRTWARVGVHVDQAADLAGFANCGVQHRPNFANAAPSIADMDGDGSLELVVPGDVYNCAIGDPAGDLYYLPWILRIDRTRWSNPTYDWTVLPTPEPSGGPLSQDFNLIQNSVSNAVLADLDGDGLREILFPAYDGRMHVWWLDKTERHSWPYAVPGSGFRFAAEPAVVDIDNDGFAEVLFTSWPQNGGNRVGQLHLLNYRGEPLFAVDLPVPRGEDWNGGLAAPTLANLDADPEYEIVIGTSGSGAVAYDLPNSANARVLWGTARGNARRTGLAPPPPPLGVLFRDGFE